MANQPPRNPRAEASEMAGVPALVLEPSPPAVDAEPWFADDPASLDGEAADHVSPTTAGLRTWNDLAQADAALAEFAREHWLANHKSLASVPLDYDSAKNDFHRVAYGVVSNARKAANGKFGLRYTYRGFGTPFFGSDEQVRVEGDRLVLQRGNHAESEPITTLRRAAEFARTVANSDQAEHDTIELGDLDRQLEVSEEVGLFLGDWFGFGTAVLEQARLMGSAADDVSRVQIWPGHFDPAVEIGSADAGHRASYGASPGDHSHPEPYLYVAAWSDIDTSHMHWNSELFNGAVLPYDKLRTASDPYRTAIEFFGLGYELLRR